MKYILIQHTLVSQDTVSKGNVSIYSALVVVATETICIYTGWSVVEEIGLHSNSSLCIFFPLYVSTKLWGRCHMPYLVYNQLSLFPTNAGASRSPSVSNPTRTIIRILREFLVISLTKTMKTRAYFYFSRFIFGIRFASEHVVSPSCV